MIRIEPAAILFQPAQQINIKQYVYIALCILYIFITLGVRVGISESHYGANHAI